MSLEALTPLRAATLNINGNLTQRNVQIFPTFISFYQISTIDALKAIVDCLIGREDSSTSDYVAVNSDSELAYNEKEDRIAADAIEILFSTEKPGIELQKQLNQIVHTEGWYEALAKRILDQLVAALKARKSMRAAMKAAYDRACHAAEDFVHEHPVYAAAILTVIAIGVLVLLVPWAVEALGFAEMGPVEGSFAAWWQSTFPDAEAGSFFSYLQRLGMTWGRK